MRSKKYGLALMLIVLFPCLSRAGIRPFQGSSRSLAAPAPGIGRSTQENPGRSITPVTGQYRFGDNLGLPICDVYAVVIGSELSILDGSTSSGSGHICFGTRYLPYYMTCSFESLTCSMNSSGQLRSDFCSEIQLQWRSEIEFTLYNPCLGLLAQANLIMPI